MKRKFFVLALIALGIVLVAQSASALPGSGPLPPRPIARPGGGDQPTKSDN